MGFVLSWAAIKGISPEEINKRLRLVATGKIEEFPESCLTGMMLPTGYYLLVFNCEMLMKKDLRKLSKSCELIFCFVEEHVMFSISSKWQDSKEMWSVYHDSSKGIMHLESHGNLPDIYKSIKDKLIADQRQGGSERSDVDYIFDIPVVLAQKITGYSYTSYDENNKFIVYKKRKTNLKTLSNRLTNLFRNP